MNLKYGEDGRTLQHATLAGDAAIDLATKSGTGGQKLAGELMDIALEPDGSVRNAHGARGGRGHAAGHEGHGRRAPSGRPSLTATGNPQGLREMKFDEKVEYREAATKTQGARVIRGADPRSRSRIGHRRVGRSALHRRRRLHRRAHARDERRRRVQGRRGHHDAQRQGAAPAYRERRLVASTGQCHRRHAQPALADRHRPRQQHHAAVEEARRQRARGQSSGLLADQEPVGIVAES